MEKGLNLLITIQQQNNPFTPTFTPGSVKKKRPRAYKQVDISLRHYAGHGLKKINKALADAQREYKENSKRARHAIFVHNHEGIAKHGPAWINMNASQKLKWYKELVMSDARMPSEVIEWAKQRKLM